MALQCVSTIFAMRAQSPTDEQVTSLFNHFLTLVSGGAYTLILKAGPETMDQEDPSKTRATTFRGEIVQLKDNEKVSLSVSEVDSKGAPVDASPGSISFTTDDSNVATIDTSDPANPFMVAGMPGSTVLTGTDGTLSGTLAVDVLAGDVAGLTITTGDPVPQ